MGLETADQWFSQISEELEEFCRRVDDKIDKEQQQLKACKKKTEIETKLTQELKLNAELNERLAELSRRGNELDRVCASLDNLHIADSDRNRLDNAKETYQLAKELTGIRLDFSAPPNVVKGYFKSESRKLLQAFEFSSSGDSEALWRIIQATAAPVWPMQDKENTPNN